MSVFFRQGAWGDETLDCFVSTSQDESRVSGELCVAEAVLVVMMYGDMWEREKQRLSVKKKTPSSQKSCWKGGRWGVFVLFLHRVTQGVAPELGATNNAPVYALVQLQGRGSQSQFTPRHPFDSTVSHSLNQYPLARLQHTARLRTQGSALQ